MIRGTFPQQTLVREEKATTTIQHKCSHLVSAFVFLGRCIFRAHASNISATPSALQREGL